MDIILDERVRASITAEPMQIIVKIRCASTIIDMAMTRAGALAFAKALHDAASRMNGS